MSGSTIVFSCALPPQMAGWRSLVLRSIAAWENIAVGEDAEVKQHIIDSLQEWRSLDDFLNPAGSTFMLWFFQKRSAFMSQTRLKKWSRDNLEDYILLPATNGFVSRRDCFFVSHFWIAPDDPDPDVASIFAVIRLNLPLNHGLTSGSIGHRCLPTMPGIIRNCGFTWFYPPFEPRLWILYEIAEFYLTSVDVNLCWPDIKTYAEHIEEMLSIGVKATLDSHGYRCSYDRDRRYLTSWLELLVILKKLNVDVDDIRRVMDSLTWHRHCSAYIFRGLMVEKYEGTLNFQGVTHEFSPFPQEDAV